MLMQRRSPYRAGLSDLKRRLRISLLDSRLGDLQRRIRAEQEILAWEKAGCPVPPPHIVKELVLKDHAYRFGTSILVETGTYLGDMVYAMKDHFERVVSIELADIFYEHATRRFRMYPNVQIIQGDSGATLSEVISAESRPCLFWLDGHYSAGLTAKGEAETPVMKELESILSQKDRGHVILIDDARCFDGTHDYPTIEAVRSFVGDLAPGYELSVKDDIIRITPEKKDVVGH